ncbi:MAG TPA: S41 family peptidase [Dehalococcoidia bacterium]|jgi:hypothetical protein|nr:S41 family peptidase [Dehalococcoidia bacterium]
MEHGRIGPLPLGSTMIGLLIGAALIVGMPAFASRVEAQVDRSKPVATTPGPVEWQFSEPQPDWKPAPVAPGLKTVELERTTDALRVILSKGADSSTRTLQGSIYLDLPDWRREDWADVVVRARTTGSVNAMSINATRGGSAEFRGLGTTPIVRDGLIHTYRILLDWGGQQTGSWRRIELQFRALEPVAPSTIDLLFVRVVPTAVARPQGRITETILEPSQLKSDFGLFRLALEEAHPALYRYATERQLDAEFARAEAKLTRPMTLLQFRNVLAPVLAAIKDGHTQFPRYRGDEIRAVVNASKQFPLALTFELEPTRAFVVLNQGLDDRVKPGMEVLAINGQSLANILQRILPNLMQDGDNRSHQLYQLGIDRGFFQNGRPGATGFSEAYRLYIGNPSSFRTTLHDPQTGKTVVVDLAGATLTEAAVNAESNPVNHDVLAGLDALRTVGNTARNSIRYLDGEDTAILRPGDLGPTFPEFLKEAFAGLRSKGTKNLIIDVRGHTGGFDLSPRLLLSYLSSKEELPAPGRVYMKTFQPSFARYTHQDIDPAIRPYFGSAGGFWAPAPGGGWLMTEKYFAGIDVDKPTENHFAGPVYILMDGGTFSAGAAIPGMAARAKRATLIGEETGGAIGGDTGGGDIGPTLPASHLHFRIPMEAYFTAEAYLTAVDARRGILPTHEVRQSVADLARGRDTALEFTRELIRNRKGTLERGR